jgi:hypothetical protein
MSKILGKRVRVFPMPVTPIIFERIIESREKCIPVSVSIFISGATWYRLKEKSPRDAVSNTV